MDALKSGQLMTYLITQSIHKRNFVISFFTIYIIYFIHL